MTSEGHKTLLTQLRSLIICFVFTLLSDAAGEFCAKTKKRMTLSNLQGECNVRDCNFKYIMEIKWNRELTKPKSTCIGIHCDNIVTGVLRWLNSSCCKLHTQCCSCGENDLAYNYRLLGTDRRWTVLIHNSWLVLMYFSSTNSTVSNLRLFYPLPAAHRCFGKKTKSKKKPILK